MEQFNIEWKNIASVKPYARNAKKHDDKQIKRYENLTGQKAVKIS